MTNSRWDTQPLIRNGKTVTVDFGPLDLQVCKLLCPERFPWGYQYLPRTYFALFLKRGQVAFRRRLGKLIETPGRYLRLPDQPENNYRDRIFALDKGGADELREAGVVFPPIKYLPLPHTLMACLIAASFELSGLPIEPIELKLKHERPDWIPFTFQGRTILIEADTGSETIETETQAIAINLKFEKYLKAIIDGELPENTLILFVSPRQSRVDSIIEQLKRTIDHLKCDHDLADYFGFMQMPPLVTKTGRVIPFSKYLKALPPATSWVVDNPCYQAGKAPYPFIKLREEGESK